MRKNRRLSVAVASLLLFYAAEAPPHTVHHGLDHVNPQECPVLAVSDQTNGGLPDDFSLSILAPLPLTDIAPILHLIPIQESLYEVSRARAPPLSS